MKKNKIRMLCALGVVGFLVVIAINLKAGAESPAAGKISGKVQETGSGKAIPGATVRIDKNGPQATTGSTGLYTLESIPAGKHQLTCQAAGYVTQTAPVTVVGGQEVKLNFSLAASPPPKIDSVKAEEKPMSKRSAPSKMKKVAMPMASEAPMVLAEEQEVLQPGEPQPQFNTEEYDRIHENGFLLAVQNPLSTFSIDVDTASYSNTRRFLTSGSLPPKDAVRIEEFINYFPYDYQPPTGPHPFSINTEISTCPWKKSHRLVSIGLQGKKIDLSQMPPFNLVFLLDVSGSMEDENKLPLLREAMKLLVEQMRPNDRIAITVYAGAAGMVLPSTPGREKKKIIAALDRLSAGGSTAGGEGIKLAYDVAKQNLIKDGNNRIVLCTDGDFNVGPSSDAELERMIEERRNQGIFLTVLGFGMGNYKDTKMMKLADKGNGNYAYIDNLMEARKVLVNQMSGTMLTIAKDVKIQIEFNPAKVKAYRLVGYEKRMLNKEDFDNDKKDAGELGAGHTVTAFYEIIPASSDEKVNGASDLKYQTTSISPEALKSPELLTVKLSYKLPKEDQSTLLTSGLVDRETPFDKTSENFRFASAVAEFALILRDSEFKGDATFESLVHRAKNSMGKDQFGYRNEFVQMAEKAQGMMKK